jgi:hypothetical protein
MTAVIEHVEGHYETHATSYGHAYIWHPECVVVGCDCGEMAILTVSESVCGCGTDHEALVLETTTSRGTRRETPHPWDKEYREWRERQDEFLRSERAYHQELGDID